MKVVTVEQMRSIERAVDAQGLSYAMMMENAGRAVASWLQGRGVVGGRVLVLVGPGNNGGDGLVAARYLHQAGAAVTIYCWKRQTEGDENWRLAESASVPIVRGDGDERHSQLRRLVAESDWILDSLLGTGVTRPISGTLQKLLATVSKGVAKRRATGKPGTFAQLLPTVQAGGGSAPAVLAVDVPSGVDCDTGAVDPATLPADVTVTFGFPKLGQFAFPAADVVGELVIADIGIPPKLAGDVAIEVSTPDLVRAWLPRRPLDANKGTFGKAMVVAGSSNYTGAAYLAAGAALRAGTGLVTLAVAEPLHPILASRLAEATYLLLPHEMGALVPEAVKTLQEPLGDYDALLLGPGLGRDEKTVEFVSVLLNCPPAGKKPPLGFLGPAEAKAHERSRLPPLVIDADGLNALVDIGDWAKSIGVPAVLTPHPGEMARLFSTSVADIQADRIGVARRAAREWQVVVLLKGAYTVVASPEGMIYINPFANPTLATAGTGDVLAGAIVGLLAQGLPPLHAAVTGAYVHGLAGQMVGEELGLAGAVAGDVLAKLALSFHRIAAI